VEKIVVVKEIVEKIVEVEKVIEVYSLLLYL